VADLALGGRLEIAVTFEIKRSAVSARSSVETAARICAA